MKESLYVCVCFALFVTTINQTYFKLDGWTAGHLRKYTGKAGVIPESGNLIFGVLVNNIDKLIYVVANIDNIVYI